MNSNIYNILKESLVEEKTYRAMLKSEFAGIMGVSMQTFRKYIKPYASKLKRMGVTSRAHLLPPKAVKFLCEIMAVDIYGDELAGQRKRGGGYVR